MPPICLDTLLYVWRSPICLDAPVCLDTPVCLDDVWMPTVHTQHKESMLYHTKAVSICPIHLDAPSTIECPHMFGHPSVCLDTTNMFGCPQYVWTPLYVWMMFGCPPYIHNTKKACFVTLRECPYAPYI